MLARWLQPQAHNEIPTLKSAVGELECGRAEARPYRDSRRCRDTILGVRWRRIPIRQQHH